MSYSVTRRSVRYLGNRATKEVHDLGNEWPICQVDDILRGGHAVGFIPDTLVEARSDGYDACHWCIGSAEREGEPQ